jgi:chromosome segregation ATPase
VLHFGLETRYHERLTRTHENLRELTEEVERLDARYDAFVRTRQAASHSYVGYDDRIAGLRARVGEALERLGSLMARQGHLLETVAIEELGLRRDRLEAYQNQARFALADSYDRAAKAQTQAR